MNDLTIVSQNGQLLVDSREVAEMTCVRHADLLEKINGYAVYLLNGEFRLVDFFIKSSYQDSTGRELPCYLLTRKGCDMVANKMTGEKGVLFTAAYVTKFEEMEARLNTPMSQLEILAQAAQALVEQDRAIRLITARQDQQAEQLQGIRDVVALSPNDWRRETSNLIAKMAHQLGGTEHIRNLRAESYKLLNDRFGVSLETRLTNKRNRMAGEGVCKSKRDKLNGMDVIGDDKKLIEGYVAIIKDMAIRYGVWEITPIRKDSSNEAS